MLLFRGIVVNIGPTLYTQTYAFPYFFNNIWSSLLCPPVIVLRILVVLVAVGVVGSGEGGGRVGG